MSNLFNKTKLQKKLKTYKLETNKINEAKEIFSRWLNDVDTTKEAQHQESFLREFFVEILNYSAIAGKKDNTLWWESGSVVDGKKPDGILGFNVAPYKSIELKQAGDIRVVIELKDSTVKLDEKQNRKDYKGSSVKQAFSYESIVGGNCEFVIVSNFLEIRLYKSLDEKRYHSFMLEELAYDDDKIKEFIFLLAEGRLFTIKPNQSIVHELIQTEDTGKEIEKEFYTHYKNLREKIWEDLIDQNKGKEYGRNFYLYKAQKLIDRIIFIRFCRENGALDNDAVLEALNNKFILGKYNRMKALFVAMNEGNPEIGIAKFNGGLFSEDKDLDCLNISDDIISKIIILYNYNFGSDLDVNILGHIFEQSISDLEDLTDKSSEKKRKKDGIFYTPAYITEYIVNEAVGGWLADRKLEIKATKNTKDWWQEYAEKLKGIKIVDPACGSGAFLVKVFDYLQAQWDEVHRQIKTDYTYKDILTNNIYGVDLNPTSVGITKLSLWLKTAHYKQPLTTLDNNIKVGNSLIDDEDVAGYYYELEGEFRSEIIVRDLLSRENLDKDTEDGIKTSLAFKWKEQLVEVFAKGGFDVVVGNPPYVDNRGFNKKDLKYLSEKFQVSFSKSGTKKFKTTKLNLANLFIENSINILNNHGYVSLLVHKNLFRMSAYTNMRKYIIDFCSLCNLTDWGAGQFENVIAETTSFLLKKININKDIKNKNIKTHVYSKEKLMYSGIVSNANIANNEDYIFNFNSNNIDITNIIKKISLINNSLSEVVNINNGVVTGNDKVFLYDKRESCDYKKAVRGKDISRYNMKSSKWLKYDKSKLLRPRNESIFQQDKIIIQMINSHFVCTFDNSFTYNLGTTYAITLNPIIKNISLLFILSLLNSKVLNYFYSNKFTINSSLTNAISVYHLEQLPIPKISESEQQPFIQKAQEMLDLNKEFNDLSNEFLDFLKVKFSIEKPSTNLKNWYSLDFDIFLKELKKHNKTLSLEDEQEWFKIFKSKQPTILELKNKIESTDKQIDNMVYKLYNLSEEEIKIVENLEI